MDDRSRLGPADVDDATLTSIVADLLGHPTVDLVDLLDVRVDPVAYDVPSITTTSRHWVSGVARTPTGDEPWRIFVKHVQSWRHSPFFASVPDEHRERAAAMVPWRTEGEVYRSDLSERLPDGLGMTRALAVRDVEPDGMVLWLAEVPVTPVVWDAARHERAAYLLGRLAASPRVAVRRDVGGFTWSLWDYVHGRLGVAVIPALLDDATWRRPDVAAAFDDDLRDRLRSAAASVEAYAAELAAQPVLTAHGDASPGNLLPGPGPDDFVLIDFGFWLPQPVGFDLGQLIAGDVQLGRAPAADLPGLDAACVAAYTRGLADEGTQVDIEVVRRAHALQLLLFVGLSLLPDEEDLPAAVVAQRASLARFSLDLVAATATPGQET